MINPTYALILQLLPCKKINIIDYGCGDGLLLNYIPKNIIKSYIGFDINEDSIKNAEDKYRGKQNISFRLIKKNKKINIGNAGNTDALVLIGVMQYMTDQETVGLLEEAKKILNKDGVLIISCAVDHPIYRILNLYRFFLHHRYIDHRKLVEQIEGVGLKVDFQEERGLIFTPIFSHILTVFFDGIDKILFKTSGTLGPVGSTTRGFMNPISWLEYRLPINYGYTFFLKASKEVK